MMVEESQETLGELENKTASLIVFQISHGSSSQNEIWRRTVRRRFVEFPKEEDGLPDLDMSASRSTYHVRRASCTKRNLS